MRNFTYKRFVSIPNRDLCKLQRGNREREAATLRVSIPNRDLCKLQRERERERRGGSFNP